MTGERRPWERSAATGGLDWAREERLADDDGPDEPGPPPPVPSSGRGRRTLRTAFIALGAALIGGVAGGATVSLFDSDAPGSPAAATVSTAGPVTTTRVELTSAISDAAAKGQASVVRIESERRSNGRSVTDVGSGVVIDDGGHIVTNAHVVIGTDALRVFLADGSERQAYLIGHDSPFTDVAVLQIGPGGPPPLAVGDSAALRPGETVVAVGNPLSEFAGAVTVGVISGINRVRVFDGVRNADLVQTDAALNHGNSGGALLNLAGQFIGMPTAILRESAADQSVEGIGFALPSNRVFAVARAIIQQGGALPRPSLGAEHADLSPELAVRAGLAPGTTGAIILSVVPGGPAATAGIRTGDVVTRVGEYDVGNARPLLNALMEYQAEQTVTVVLDRNGRTVETQVRLGRRG